MRYLAAALVLFPLITSLLLWFLPASLVWRGLEVDQYLPYGVRVTLPRGTVREGYTTLRFRTFPASKLSWALITPNFTEGTFALRYRVQVEGPNHAADATVSLQNSGLNLLGVTGFVESEDINRLAGPFGHQFSGRLNANLSNIRWNPPCIEAATGRIDWTGGLITLNLFDRTSSYPLPALETKLQDTDCGVKLLVSHQKKNLADLQLTNQGWFIARLEPALLRLAKVPDANQIKQSLLFEEKIL